ncbi:MAG: TetR/AcrR family transcriptional regulator [Actinomycetota bacterium]|nr:TetR/AcrR family transcriptional regulator [Actinomycetota bacterium]
MAKYEQLLVFIYSPLPSRLAPRKQPKQQRSAATRTRILDAAARVFAEHGYAAGTTNRIAAEAALSVGSLYQYFPNKDSILVELVRRHVAEGAERVADALNDAQDPLAAVVDAALANHVDSPRLHQVLFEEAPRPPELLAELHALEGEVVDRVARLLSRDRLVAWMVVAMVESLVHRYISSHTDRSDTKAFAAELNRAVRAYLGAR